MKVRLRKFVASATHVEVACVEMDVATVMDGLDATPLLPMNPFAVPATQGGDHVG